MAAGSAVAVEQFLEDHPGRISHFVVHNCFNRDDPYYLQVTEESKYSTILHSDPFACSSPADNKARIGHYGVDSYPVVMIDGICDAWPITTMQQYFDARMLEPCYLSISVAAVAGSTESSGTLLVSLVSETGLDTDATLNLMLTESGVPGSGTFGTQPFNDGLRDNLCSHDGRNVRFGSSPESIEIDVDYTIDPTWVWDQLYLTAFAQSPATDEVLNSCMVKMSDLL